MDNDRQQALLSKLLQGDKLGDEIFVKWTNIKNCRPVANSEGKFV